MYIHFISRGCNLTNSPTAFTLRLTIYENGTMSETSAPIAPTSANKTVATLITATTTTARTPQVSTTTSNDKTVTKLDLSEIIPSHFLIKNIIVENRNF